MLPIGPDSDLVAICRSSLMAGIVNARWMVGCEVGEVGCLMGFWESMACMLVDDRVATTLAHSLFAAFSQRRAEVGAYRVIRPVPDPSA